MQLGATLAGLAIENSMLGAAHALANPLTARFGIAHGEAVALMLPHVIRHNGRAVGQWYAELVDGSGDVVGLSDTDNPAEALAAFVAQLSRQAGLAGTLDECGVPSKELATLAVAATRQWTGTFNPIPMSLSDFQSLYEAAL
jgi:alcohol dehydrogenase